MLDVRNMSQSILSPTHEAEHTLDWIITRNDYSIFKIFVNDICIFDHFQITFQLDITKPKRPVREIMS